MEPDSSSENMTAGSRAVASGAALLQDAESFKTLMQDLQTSMFLPVHQHKTRCIERALRYLNRALPTMADFHKGHSNLLSKGPEPITVEEDSIPASTFPTFAAKVSL
jgi:hypothetical protein